ncbi:hypothetical protein PoB_006341000 [Plakobranchus ocellatus]|uniref:Uncharacterized protein n=1 Tax=Plakobranchus ocellatus TaxID=259542 RepID=A0AAV4CYM6_9GAST|nr:hypothetical protein PoB_006341000 [Plakobranchus ocellatus]
MSPATQNSIIRTFIAPSCELYSSSARCLEKHPLVLDLNRTGGFHTISFHTSFEKYNHFSTPVHIKVISGFKALRQAGAPMVGLEPSREGSLQILGRVTLRRRLSRLCHHNYYPYKRCHDLLRF